MQSITYQALQRYETEPPPNLENAIQSVLACYPKSPAPTWARNQALDEREFLEYFRKQAEFCLVKDSSPGIPYVTFGKTNHDVMMTCGPFIYSATKARLQLISSTPLEELRSKTAYQLSVEGYCDPIRVFVKNEPHNRVKMAQGRYRIISSVSLVDNLLQRCVFDDQDRAEISSWTSHPSQPGLGFNTDKTKQFLSQLPSSSIAEADVSGWDWSVQGWELSAEAVLRCRLLTEPNPYFEDILVKLMFIISLSTFTLSDGQVFTQLRPGIMKSGAKITSSSNSRIRVLAHHILNPSNPWCVAMGDDSLERPFTGAVQAYQALGHPTKMFTERARGEEFEFCGHIYNPISETCRPTNVVKMLVRYCVLASPNADQRVALFTELTDALQVEKEWVANVLRCLGEEAPNATQTEG